MRRENNSLHPNHVVAVDKLVHQHWVEKLYQREGKEISPVEVNQHLAQEEERGRRGEISKGALIRSITELQQEVGINERVRNMLNDKYLNSLVMLTK